MCTKKLSFVLSRARANVYYTIMSMYITNLYTLINILYIRINTLSGTPLLGVLINSVIITRSKDFCQVNFLACLARKYNTGIVGKMTVPDHDQR